MFGRDANREPPSKNLWSYHYKSLHYTCTPIYTNNQTNGKDSLKNLVSQLVNKFPILYGTRRFITVFTTARHLSLPWSRSIQFTQCQLITFNVLFNIISLPLPRLSQWSFSLGCPHQNPL